MDVDYGIFLLDLGWLVGWMSVLKVFDFFFLFFFFSFVRWKLQSPR